MNGLLMQITQGIEGGNTLTGQLNRLLPGVQGQYDQLRFYGTTVLTLMFVDIGVMIIGVAFLFYALVGKLRQSRYVQTFGRKQRSKLYVKTWNCQS